MPFEKGNKLGKKWKPGETGNEGGRPKIATEIRDLAKLDAPDAYRAVKDIMADPDNKQRLAAALAILKVAGVPMSEDKAQGGQEASQPVLDRDMSDEDLMQAAAKGEA
jgi:hypothetical protein